MLKKTNEAIIAEIQLLNADGTVATGATVTAQVYDNTYSAFSTPAVTEIGATGIYKATFTPNAAGLWTITFTCASPSTIKTAGFFVQDAITTDIGSILTNTNKIGTVTNTGGTATIGAIFGDFANVTLVNKLANLASSVGTLASSFGTIVNTGGTASIGAVLGDVANVSIATRLGYLPSDTTTQLDTNLPAVKAKTDLIGASVALESGGNLATILTAIQNGTYGLSAIEVLLAALNTSLTFVHQPDATLSQASPVSAQVYTILDTTANCRIINMVASCTWSGQPSPLVIRVIIDGVTINFTINNPSSSLTYVAVLAFGLPVLSVTGYDEYGKAFLLEGRSVKVQVLITGGTVSNLAGRVTYAKR